MGMYLLWQGFKDHDLEVQDEADGKACRWMSRTTTQWMKRKLMAIVGGVREGELVGTRRDLD